MVLLLSPSPSKLLACIMPSDVTYVVASRHCLSVALLCVFSITVTMMAPGEMCRRIEGSHHSTGSLSTLVQGQVCKTPGLCNTHDVTFTGDKQSRRIRSTQSARLSLCDEKDCKIRFLSICNHLIKCFMSIYEVLL